MKTKIIRKKLLSTILAFTFLTPSFAQINKGGTPFSFSEEGKTMLRATKSISSVTIPDLDMDVIKKELNLEEDDCASCRQDKYYEKEVDVFVSFFEEATPSKVQGGTIWLLNLVSEGAYGYQLLFNKFILPEGSSLFIYNEDKSMTLGAFTSDNHREDQRFVTQYILESSIYIEYFEPNGITEIPEIELEKVVYIFNENAFRAGPHSSDGGAESCMKNVICIGGSEWDAAKRSVALILLRDTEKQKYWGHCSGALINISGNYKGTDQPYFLSANHCYQEKDEIISDPADWVFLFRHEGGTCGSTTPVDYTTNASAVGATVIANDHNSKKSDYLLLKLKNTVNDIKYYDISFAGWNNTQSQGTSSKEVYGIHHPKGDIKKMSVSNKAPVISSYLDETGPKNYWKVIWDDGVTAPGSSGSPLFDWNQRVIGFLHGGKSYCTDRVVNGKTEGPKSPDYYGQFSSAWEDGNFKAYLSNNNNLINSVNSYTPTFDISDMNLSGQVVGGGSIGGNNVIKGENFTLKVTASNGHGKITWQWWINKKAHDFNDYNGDDRANCFYWEKTSTNKESETEALKFTESGTYKVKVWAFDEKYNQSQITFYFYVVADPCVSVNFGQESCGIEHYIVAAGSNLNFIDDVYIPNGYYPYYNNCYTRKHPFSSNYYPKYDGVKFLSWYYDYRDSNNRFVTIPNTTKITEYNCTFESSLVNSKYTKYYVPRKNSYCIKVNKEHAGKQIRVRLSVRPGILNVTSSRLEPPLNGISDSDAAVAKEFFVVDCDSEKKITTATNLPKDTETVTWGVLEVAPTSSITISSGETKNLKAYKSITLKPGVHIKSGANFSAKALDCPLINDCGCTPVNKSTQREEDTTGFRETEHNNGIFIYPNPVINVLNIELENPEEVLSIEVFNTIGQRFFMEDSAIGYTTHINTNEYPIGVYFVKIKKRNGNIIRKVIKKDF
ncbi:MAG: T9SS type A sorting domain-containing protein [Candidatus Azobacteroides sp.]|nr:T9SS type A sorting domain-containing protein [Candidatus Azobacteroides sp.]